MNKIYVVATRAFENGDYFPGLSETRVFRNEEEARKDFIRQGNSMCDYLYDSEDRGCDSFSSSQPDDNTVCFWNGETEAVVTLTEIEIPE